MYLYIYIYEPTDKKYIWIGISVQRLKELHRNVKLGQL